MLRNILGLLLIALAFYAGMRFSSNAVLIKSSIPKPSPAVNRTELDNNSVSQKIKNIITNEVAAPLELSTKIRWTLTRYGGDKLSSLKVDVKEHDIWIKGSVDFPEQKTLVSKLVEPMAEGKTLHNEISVAVQK